MSASAGNDLVFGLHACNTFWLKRLGLRTENHPLAGFQEDALPASAVISDVLLQVMSCVAAVR